MKCKRNVARVHSIRNVDSDSGFLRHGIVVTIPVATHARLHMVRFEERLPVIAAELTTLVRVSQDARA